MARASIAVACEGFMALTKNANHGYASCANHKFHLDNLTQLRGMKRQNLQIMSSSWSADISANTDLLRVTVRDLSYRRTFPHVR